MPSIHITYDVTTSFTLTVERDEIPDDHAELLDSVTREELAECPMDVHEVEWCHLKTALQQASPENTWVMDEENKPLYQ